MSTAAIDCQKLSKRYGSSLSYALQDLDIQVQKGEIYGFLGPNGAGKSTAIRTLMNFLQPSGGGGRILGLDIVRESVAIKKSVGYLAGEIALYPRMTGHQFLDYMSALQPVKDTEYRAKLCQEFKAELDRPIETLSKGNRQKLGIIQAFMHKPEVLILDEPTGGLDPLMQSIFYELAESAKQRGAAVFLSSHDLTEVRKMCDRIGFIREGRLVAEKTLADLQQSAAHSFDVTFRDSPPLSELRKIKHAEVKSLTSKSVNLQLKGDLQSLFAVLAKHTVVSLDKHEVNLEEEFLHLYNDPAKDEIK